MIQQLVKDIQTAERPVLLVGGGCQGAREEVRTLAQSLEIPCIPTWNACDIITSDFPYYVGRAGTYGMRSGNFTLQNADLILAIGCRFSGRLTGGYIESFARAAKIYVVDIDGLQLKHPTVRIDTPIHQDAREFILESLETIKEIPEFSQWLGRARAWLNKYPVVTDFSERSYLNPYVFIKVLSENLTSQDIIVSDCGGNVVVTYQAFEAKWGQRLISSHGNSPMGFAFAGALGACFAAPDRRVICLIGDGGFNMNIQELQTIKNYKIRNLRVFIMNNHSYGITRQFQDTHFESRYEASGPKGYTPPDFTRVAHAYDLPFWRIHDLAQLRQSLNTILDYPDTIICDLDNGYFGKYEPRIFGWKTPIEDLYPYLPRDEFKENMIIEPVEGWENPALPAGKERTGWGEEKYTIP